MKFTKTSWPKRKKPSHLTSSKSWLKHIYIVHFIPNNTEICGSWITNLQYGGIQIIHFRLGFSIINHPFWGIHIYGNPECAVYGLEAQGGWTKANIHMSLENDGIWDFDMLNTDCLETRQDLSPWRSASKTASKCPGSLGGFEWTSKSNSSYAPPEWTAVNGWICHSPSPLGCESPVGARKWCSTVVFSTWFYTCLPSMKRWWTIRRYPRGPHTRFSRISRRILQEDCKRLQKHHIAPYS